MSSLPPELVERVEQLRAKLVEINTSEQNCMIDIMTNASRGTSIPEVQAVMARCRQAAAAAATTAIDTFRSECSIIGGQANSWTKAAIATTTATNVADFWTKSESYAAAFMAEVAALLPAHGPDKTTQAINNTCNDRSNGIEIAYDTFGVPGDRPLLPVMGLGSQMRTTATWAAHQPARRTATETAGADER